MVLHNSDIDNTVCHMDETYDANFGEWIRNEENARIVGCNLKKYINEYQIADFVVVLKWIVKDWTLRSIIVLVKKMIVDDLYRSSKTEYKRRIQLIKELICTWNPIFICEFILSVTKNFTVSEKVKFITHLLSSIEKQKSTDIIYHLIDKLDPKVKNMIRRTLVDRTNNTKRNKEGCRAL
ncbi:hypothetical protein CWI38_1401p0030 [Hamiltosporidium tvaerminnensis]|uniref:Uncharacterized protein n=2 Tax=Hamiltosporidium TaxID=1176354 RepID=A0A4Q9LDL7_9MICR|nr:hypothetical protein CWI37_1244p0020 [Hamiltosporidium tvaerminnensis]TBU05646.1 hypothetical protein CWI36_0604p0010 [Hamiltosporidium magnivora]TBU09591.1 hypothetical protein CWI39_0058p0040 [Hamiltosporidium magnivora]TBU11073.1 hypothetical protein CWI38_1401p0030 [Hamiltosporidium tvaerminnensis]